MNPGLLAIKKRSVVASYASVVLGDGATHLWMLNETTGTVATDLGASPVNGTYTGSFALGQPTGLAGLPTALSLTGNGYVITGAASFLAHAAITVEGWVRQNGTSNGNLLSINYNSGVRLQVSATGANLIFNSAQIATTPISKNTWYHFVCTLQSSGTAIFINGTQKTTGSGWPSTSSSYQAYMGQIGISAEYLTGDIAAVAIYPSILTATQIANHYNAGK